MKKKLFPLCVLLVLLLIAVGAFTKKTRNEENPMMTDKPTVLENPEIKILPIAELNRGGTDGDHMEDDYNTASVEADFRSKVLLNSATTGSFRYDSAFYPRVKKVRDDLYLLLYHYTQTGQHLYYATSRDGVHWNAPEVLYNRVDHKFVYEYGDRTGQTDGYYAVVQVGAGETLYASVHACEVIVRAGDTAVVSPFTVKYEEQGLSDTTEGKELYNGESVPKNHTILIPRDDGRGISVGEGGAWLMVRGDYRIVETPAVSEASEMSETSETSETSEAAE